MTPATPKSTIADDSDKQCFCEPLNIAKFRFAHVNNFSGLIVN
jgi:hypothetical protein